MCLFLHENNENMSVSSKTGKINVLQDVILQISSSSNSNLKAVNQHKNDIYSNSLIYRSHNSHGQNGVNVDHNSTFISKQSKHTLPVERLTASEYFFDEEPVFSDSEEEKEYNRKCFETQDLGSLFCATPKKRSIEVQCNLYAEDSDILDLIRKGASINTAGVNDDFKVLINLCRQLQYKYKYDIPSPKRNSSIIQKNDSSRNMGNTTTEIQSVHQSGTTPSSKNFNSYGVSENITPSRSGNSFGNNDLICEGFCTFDKNIVKKSSHNNKCDVNEMPLIRRSTRRRKLVQRDNCASPIKRKDLILPIATTNTRKRKRNSMPINLENCSKRVSKTTRRNVKSRTSERRTCRSINKSTKNNKKLVKDVLCRRNNNKLATSRYKSRPSFAMKTEENMVNLQDNVHIKIPLPKKLVRSLARNWMNPNRSALQNYELTVSRNRFGCACPRHKMRRLYSPEKWLHSEELNNICMT